MKRLLTFLLLLAPAAAQDGTAMTVQEVMCLIETIEGGEADTRTVTIDRGTADGLVQGSQGTLWAVWGKKKSGGERDCRVIGRAILIKATRHYGTVRVTMNKAEGDGLVRAGDAVEFKARVPGIAKRSPLWKLACLHIGLKGPIDAQPFLPYRLLYANETPKLVNTLLDLMVEQIRDTGERYADQVMGTQKYTQGRYRGKTAREVMTAVRREDIADFLAFVAEYPGKYIGQNWRIDEVFATWVINAAPSGVQPTTLLARTEDKLVERLAETDLRGKLTFDPRDVPELPAKTKLLAYFPGERFLHIWVYGPDGFLAWVQRDITRNDLAGQIADLRGLMNAAPNGRGFGPAAEADEKNPAAYRAAIKRTRIVLRTLHGHLLEPIASYVKPDDMLVIAPAGALARFPFEALIDSDGRFVGAATRLAYSSDTRATLRRPPARPERDVLVAFADPRGTLAASLEEVAAIKPLFADAAVHTGATGTATPEQLRRLRPDCTILHVSTHGVIHKDPLRSYLELDQGNLDVRGVFGLRTTPAFRNRSVRLVVLTADAGPDVPAAFLRSGAPSVVTAVWSPNSVATTALMTEFYKELVKEKQPVATALMKARGKLIRGLYAHPGYWAGLVLHGDWR